MFQTIVDVAYTWHEMRFAQAMESRREYISIELLTPIPDPTKYPTADELESLQPHPSLMQAVNKLLPIPIEPQLFDDDEVLTIGGGASWHSRFTVKIQSPPTIICKESKLLTAE